MNEDLKIEGPEKEEIQLQKIMKESKKIF